MLDHPDLFPPNSPHRRYSPKTRRAYLKAEWKVRDFDIVGTDPIVLDFKAERKQDFEDIVNYRYDAAFRDRKLVRMNCPFLYTGLFDEVHEWFLRRLEARYPERYT